MKTRLQHTPTPWNTCTKLDGTYAVGMGQVDVAKGMTFEDAAFIVRAVNAHKLLVEVAKEAIAEAKDCSCEGYKCLFCFAQEALARAEEK